MIAPERTTSSTPNTHGNEIPRLSGVDSSDKIEKLKRIQEAASEATRIRKISLDSNREAASRRTRHLWETGGKRLKAKHAFEKGLYVNRKEGSEEDILAYDKAIQNKQDLKLPSIVLNGRRRSSTLGCVDDLKQTFERKKKSSLDSSLLELKVSNGVIREDNKESKRHDLNIGSVDVDGKGGKEEQGSQGSLEVGAVTQELNSESDSVTAVYRLCGGRKSHEKSTSRQQLYPDILKTHSSKSIESERGNDTPQQVLIANNFSSKVDEFLKGNQPRSAPRSLKISKTNFNEITKTRRPHIAAVTTPKSKLSMCNDSLLNTSSFMNPFTRPDGKPWYYTSKEGRCRYLRAPMTPVLTVEEIFQNDDKQSPD